MWRARTVSLAAALALLVVGADRWVAAAATRGPQPFPINHRVHVDAKVDCLVCHEGLTSPSEPPLPELDKCAECHTEPPGDNRNKQELARLVAAGGAIAWEPRFRVPDFVFFSHRRHVDVAELQCVECHADMPARTEPPTRARTLTMSQCIDCHERHAERPAARRAVVDCAACHR